MSGGATVGEKRKGAERKRKEINEEEEDARKK